jgi:hypothetical protein
MKTILVADPRLALQESLAYALASHGYDVTGPEPDLVLTPDDGTARFWAKRGVPVYGYDAAVPPILEELLAVVAQALAPTDPPPER